MLLVNLATQALSSMQAASKAFVHLCPAVNLLASHGALLTNAEKQFSIAHTTKAEHLIALSLQKGGPKTHKRLTDIVARCSSDIKGDWKLAVHKELVAQVVAISEQPEQPAQAASGSRSVAAAAQGME